LSGAPESVSSYRALWQQGVNGIRGKVTSAKLESIKPIPIDVASQLVGSCCYIDGLTTPQAFYAIINYSVRFENEYVCNGPNARLYILDHSDARWEIVQVSEAPLRPLIDLGLGTGSLAEQELLHRQNIRMETGQFLNSRAQDVSSVIPLSVGDHTVPSGINVADSSEYPACTVVQYFGCVDFTTYVKDVLPNEWSPSWPDEALKAGALAVKMYGWYWKYHKKYANQEYDVKTHNCDQNYIAGSSLRITSASTNSAVNAMAGRGFDRAGTLFETHHYLGSSDPNDGYNGNGKHNGDHMFQKGTHYLADQFYLHDDMVHYYYDTDSQPISFFTYVDGGLGCGVADFFGTITDLSTGHTISGASVIWGSSSTTTDLSGVYYFPHIPCQTATLTVSRSGYQTSTQSYTPQCNSSNVPINVALTPTGGVCSAVVGVGVNAMTSSCSSLPIVTTVAATNVSSNSATFNATINSDGGLAILERRFDWGIYPSWTDATNLNGGSIVVSGSNFSYAASGLTPGTLYQFRAWARNSSGWATVGNGLTFTTGTAAPPVCTSFAINPSSVSPSSSANSQSVTVTGSPSGCQGGNWNATGNGSWLTVSPLNGSGSGSTTVFWSQNPFTTSRTDSATIGGRSFSVTQSGTTPPACASFTINPSSSSPSSAAGSQPVTITGSPSGCQGGSWNATGNGSWLTVSPSSGIGPGATTVFWNQNSLTSSRTDSASIAGWSYSVTQSAATGFGGGGPHAFIDVPGAAVQLHDLGVAPDGSVYVLYPTSNPNALAVVKSTDGGASWGSPVAIQNSNYSDLYHLAVDSSGAIHVVWGLSSGGGTETFYSRSTNGGASFSSPIQVRSGNTYNGYRTNNSVEPVVASDGSGNVYVAYGAYTKDGAGNFVGYNIWVSQSTNGGASFQPEFSINAISSAQKFPRRIRATASNFYVLYMDETNYDLYFYRRNVGAASGNTGRLNANTGSVQYDGDFVMAVNEMTVYGTYSDTTGDSEGNITLCKSTDGGVTWPVCTRVNDSVNRQQHTPRVGLDGLGNLHMAWADGRANGRLQIYYAYSADGGGSFTPNVNLSSPVTQTDFSQTHVAIDSPNSAVYVSATRNYSQVVVARLPMTPAAQDTIAPVGSVIINNGTSFTTSTGVLLSMSASDAVGVVGYYVSNSSSVPSSGQSGWSSVGSTTSLFTTLNGWQISSGDGFKTVYVWFKDVAGNVSSTASAGITLDQTPPSNGILTATPADHQVQLSWSGQNDATTSVGSYKLVFANGNTPPVDCSGSPLATSSPYTHTGLTNGQSYSYRLCTTDSAGNVSLGAVATATPQSGVGGVLHINNLLGDFNGDHKADVLWRIDGSGLDAMWLMNGTTKTLGQYLETAPSRWIVAGVGDFDGDGKADILWRDPVNGEDAMWLMNGPTKALGTYIESAGPQWIVAGVGDFNGDGKADILWRNPATGEDAMWLMNGPTKAVGVYIEVAGTQWVVAGVGDFNGDGKADIVWRNPASGDDAMWLMNGPTKAVGALIETAPPRWRIAGVGDFNFDGRADILWRDPANGDDAMWLMNGTTKTLGTYIEWAGATWSVAGVGDLDGDGKADIFWRDTSGLDAIWRMNGPNKNVGVYTETAPLPWRVVP
jgi:hypothetical protein